MDGGGRISSGMKSRTTPGAVVECTRQYMSIWSRFLTPRTVCMQETQEQFPAQRSIGRRLLLLQSRHTCRPWQ
jgi:hypothetical protein